MDSVLSKAFWLGRNTNIIGYITAIGGPAEENDSFEKLSRSVNNFAKSLKVTIPKIPKLDSGASISQFIETVRMDLAMIQSERVAASFTFGFHYTSWANFRGGYSFGVEAAKDAYFDIDRAKVEENLRNYARVLGPRVLKSVNESIVLAQNANISTERFKDKIGVEIVLEITSELDKIATNPPLDLSISNTVFVVMRINSGDDSLVDTLKTIQRAAEECELTAFRVDQIETTAQITDSIVDSIRKASFVVVDLTDARPNIYWEAGFAHGLGKTPVYIARKGTEPHFDVKDYPIIFYGSYDSLQVSLKRRLLALKESG